MFLDGQKENLCGSRSSPRERGCSSIWMAHRAIDEIFPARAGVFPRAGCRRSRGAHLPRESGGVPTPFVISLSSVLSSPRERGCSSFPGRTLHCDIIFPARAGVFPADVAVRHRSVDLPRESGGVPPDWSISYHKYGSSPRERGCSRPLDGHGHHECIFPARAGVFPGRTR